MPKKLTSCNAAVLMQTVVETGESEKMIKEVINHQIALISEVITSGSMESVLIRGFGTFKAKPKKLYRMMENKSAPKTTVRK